MESKPNEFVLKPLINNAVCHETFICLLVKQNSFCSYLLVDVQCAIFYGFFLTQNEQKSIFCVKILIKAFLWESLSRSVISF